MSEDLTKAQQILMWELFAGGGQKLNKDFLPKADRKDREMLVVKGLIEVLPTGQTLLLRFKGDKGWQWISDAEPFPIADGEKRVTAERRLLQSLVRGLKRYAAGQGSTIQQIFFSHDYKSGESNQDVLNGKQNGKSAIKNNFSKVEVAIVEAFFSAAGRPAKGGIRLSELRSMLQDFNRTEIDAALLAMWRSKKANLMNLDNPRDIQSEAASALVSGIHTFHVVRITE